MNKVFKSIWSKARACFVAVSEASCSVTHGAKSASFTFLCALALASPYATSESATGPSETFSVEDPYDSLVVGIDDRAAVIVPSLKLDANPLVRVDDYLLYKNVVGVQKGLYINSGRHLLLVGQENSNPNDLPVELADGAVYVGGQKPGAEEVTPSKLTLGSDDSPATAGGHLAALNVGVDPASGHAGVGGQAVVKNGEFSVDVLNNGSAGRGND